MSFHLLFCRDASMDETDERMLGWRSVSACLPTFKFLESRAEKSLYVDDKDGELELEVKLMICMSFILDSIIIILRRHRRRLSPCPSSASFMYKELPCSAIHLLPMWSRHQGSEGGIISEILGLSVCKKGDISNISCPFRRRVVNPHAPR